MASRVSAERQAQASILLIGLMATAAYTSAVVIASERSYEGWTALLIAPILIVISLPALRGQARREESAHVYFTLVVALIVKLGGALVRYAVVFGLYRGGADASVYHDAGIQLGKRFEHWDFSPLVASGSDFIRGLTGLFYGLVTPAKLGGFLVFSWLGFWGLFLLYRAFVLAVPEGRRRTYRILIFFVPSLLFWPSSIGKEAWMMLSIGLVAFGAAKLLTGYAARGIAIGGCGLFLASMVRPHIAAMLMLALLAAYLVKRPKGKEEFALLIKTAMLVVLTLSAFLLVERTNDYLREQGVDEGGGVRDTLEHTMFRTRQGGSNFDASIIDSPARAPIAAGTVLFRPLVIEASNLQGAVAALEGTALLIWCIWRWRWILAAVGSVRRQPYVAMAVAYIGIFVFGFSSIANFGILARQRVQVLPFLFVLLAIPPREGGEDDERRRSTALEQVG